ncbi:hypothetical protein D6P04_22260 [Salmonella enterica]|nr:hypothetical protein [Salmonella enterica]HAN5156480.1 hypothetical protein [Escherichia coli]HDQ2647891.1 hypothetical protein [Escherichia coli]
MRLLLRVISFVFNRFVLYRQVIPSPELPQLHFVMKDNYHTFLLSLENILLCLREAERQGEIPPVGDEWWSHLQRKFDVLRENKEK